MANDAKPVPSNFIRNIIKTDIANHKHGGNVQTRFPPEPNGYLHIGHAKSICLNFGVARDFQGKCNLRFDDTNPSKEEVEYVESIQEDVQWLGFHWDGPIRYTSTYFEDLYKFAEELIQTGKAFVCSLTPEQMREYRGTLTQPGRESPDRHRPINENLRLFRQMREGKFKDGELVLRAKIDMASPNINMRDPVIYRIMHASHHQTGDSWCIYPMYDYAHCISDALEGITHSLCTLEFEDHRPLYDWILDNISAPCHPQQIEFARLSLEYTVMSKRKLNLLVKEKHVSGWDDPRMPTIAGMRRRGYPPAAIRDFCDRIGITKVDTQIEMGVLENCIREELDIHAPRRMAVLQPLKVVISNYHADKNETLNIANHPKDESLGKRDIIFSRELYIDAEDFSENPPKKYKRLVPGGEVRLRGAYIIRCDDIIKDKQGNIKELHCSYDPTTLGKNPEDRKIKGVIHWVSAAHAIDAEVRLYDRLLKLPNSADFAPDTPLNEQINEQSLVIKKHCKLESALKDAPPLQAYQFEREGYFCVDSKDSKPGTIVVNRIVSLRDSWAKIEGQ